MNERIIDYRPETPTTCDLCGERISVTGEMRGEIYISSPSDRALAAKYGVEGDGIVETIWNTFRCANGHEGPVLQA